MNGKSNLWRKLLYETRELGVLVVYFGLWLVPLVILKALILDEYHIAVHDFSAAMIGILVLAKTVLIVGKVPMNPWIRTKPAIFSVLLRTLLYGIGVLFVLMLERAFEIRHEHGGFGSALQWLYRHEDLDHVLANSLVIAMSLFWFNILAVLRREIGEHELLRMFFSARHDRRGE